MIRIFYGDDRMRATQEIKKILGDGYEIIEGMDLEPGDLPNVFLGNSLLADQRKILIRDMMTNSRVNEKIVDYLDSPHEIILLESKVDTRTMLYKSLQKKVGFKEFKLPEASVYHEVQSIYNMAKKDGEKAIVMLEKMMFNIEPIAFLGMVNVIAMSEFETRQGRKEKRALKELSKLDMSIKTTSFSQWTLVRSFLLRLASWWSF